MTPLMICRIGKVRQLAVSYRKASILSSFLAPGLFENIAMHVLDGAIPSLAGVLLVAVEERQLWGMAGAQGLFYMTSLSPDPRVWVTMVVVVTSVTCTFVIAKGMCLAV